MDQKLSQSIFFQLSQNCQNDVAGHLHQYILFQKTLKKFTVVRHPCRLTTLPSNTRVSLSWDLTLIPISLGRHLEETRAFLMSARSLEMLRDTSEVISSITMFSSEITSKRKLREIVFLSWSLLAKSSRWKKIHSDEKSQEASIQFLMIVVKVTADMQARKSNPSKCRKGEWVSGWEIWC